MTITVGGSSITFPDATTQTTAATAAIPGVLGQVFTSSGTFTIPAGVTAIKAQVIGGGGGGGWTNSGNSGGSSSLASGNQSITTVTANGGGAGGNQFGGGGGNATNGTLNYSGGSGSNGLCCGEFSGAIMNTKGVIQNGQSQISGGGPWPPYGVGGAGYGGNGGGGGGAGYAISYLTGLTPGATLTVTVGNNGNNVGGSNTAAPTKGFVLIEW